MYGVLNVTHLGSDRLPGGRRAIIQEKERTDAPMEDDDVVGVDKVSGPVSGVETTTEINLPMSSVAQFNKASKIVDLLCECSGVLLARAYVFVLDSA